MIDDLLLLSKNDIPFPQARVNVHQPSIKEIGIIGEEFFYMGCSILTFSKEKMLNDQDRNKLKDVSDFDILMTMFSDTSNLEVQQTFIYAQMVLSLIFPEYQILIKDKIYLKKEDEDTLLSINSNNFDEFKSILTQIFCLKGKNNTDYDPAGEASRRIAEKIKKGKAKAQKSKGEKVSILPRYVSILAVGEGKDMNELLNYSLYQLFDEFERYELKMASDMHMQAAMAGAKNLKEVDNWMKDIHS